METQPAKYRSVWKKFGQQEEEDIIAVFLMQQKGFGSESKWAPYLNVIPKSLILPHMFTTQELQAIEDDNVAMEAKNRRKLMKKRYNNLKSRIDELFIGTK